MKRLLAAVSKDVMVSWEMKAFFRAAQRRGVGWVVLDPRSTNIDVTRRTFGTRTMRHVIPTAILGRVDVDASMEGVRLLRLLEGASYPVLNGADAFLLGRDKSVAALRFIKASLPHPKTWIVPWQERLEVGVHGTGPWVIKPIVGSGGRGVRLIREPGQLRKVPRANFPLLVQEYCGPVRRDLRVVVLKGQVIGCVCRTPKTGDWRGNARQGARFESTRIDSATAALAVAASAVVGANFSGVDLIETDQGAWVIEVNVCPAFAQFSEATGIDVAGRVVDALIELGDSGTWGGDGR